MNLYIVFNIQNTLKINEKQNQNFMSSLPHREFALLGSFKVTNDDVLSKVKVIIIFFNKFSNFSLFLQVLLHLSLSQSPHHLHQL